MLEVQKYLSGGKSLSDLTDELGIKIAAHPELPLVILNYCQIASPKTHPIVRECRGLTLDSRDWSVVARSFPRFFNWGEMADEMPLFDFSDCVVDSKEDGSLCVLYYFDGLWHGNTRGSFGLDCAQFTDRTWRELFLQAAGFATWEEFGSVLDQSLTYVCEFVSPWNKVVRTYHEPGLYLLTAYRGRDELPWDAQELISPPPAFRRPERFSLAGIEAVQSFLAERATTDKTFEGVVLRDRAGRRWKVKNPEYVALHRLRGEGDNLYNQKHLIRFVLKNEGDELLAYFPEVRETFYSLKSTVDRLYEEMESVWRENWRIESQKEFALSIVGQTPFTGLLFNLRKRKGLVQTEEDLRAAWIDSEDVILKVLK